MAKRKTVKELNEEVKVFEKRIDKLEHIIETFGILNDSINN